MESIADAREHQRHVTAKNALLTAVRAETTEAASYWFNLAWSNGVSLPLLTDTMRRWVTTRNSLLEPSSN